MTSRGVGVGASGLVMTVLGIGLASPILVWVGIAMVVSVTTAALWLVTSVMVFTRRFPDTSRVVIPNPLSAGGIGEVAVSIRTAAKRPRLRLDRALASQLDIREQAAAELTNGLPAKATVTRSARGLQLDYHLSPTQRGRWELGPALVKVTEPLGMMWASIPSGEAQSVPVWPLVVDLTAATGALMGQADRVAMGARTPSADDSSLREYRDGDDLRRVHWKSTARRGSMVVRADEREGVRPATVLLDLPVNSVAAEWAISACASIGASILATGHPVRLVGAGIGAGEASRMSAGLDTAKAPDNGGGSRTHLLNTTLDLALPLSRESSLERTQAAIDALALHISVGEVIVAVLDPLTSHAMASLVPFGDSGRAWAVVRTGDGPRHDERADHTATALRRAGWTVATASTRDDLTAVWSDLVAGGN